MVGIGITSYKRPEHLKLCLHQIGKHTDLSNVKLVIVEDVEGINNAKNQCLDRLKDCSDIILLDDDCFPIHDKWIEHILEAKINHLLYCIVSHAINKHIRDNIYSYWNCGGCLVYLSKAVLDGGFRYPENYQGYGFEHASLSWSIHTAGYTPYPYISLSDMGDYIYSLDYSGVGNFDIKHNPSKKYSEVIDSVCYNSQLFKKQINENSL